MLHVQEPLHAKQPCLYVQYSSFVSLGELPFVSLTTSSLCQKPAVRSTVVFNCFSNVSNMELIDLVGSLENILGTDHNAHFANEETENFKVIAFSYSAQNIHM